MPLIGGLISHLTCLVYIPYLWKLKIMNFCFKLQSLQMYLVYEV